VNRGVRAAAFVLAVAACGLKNDPVAPGRVQPLAPAKLSAVSTRDGVELRWRRPTSYTGGGRMRDLGGFDIERADAGTTAFAVVGTLSLADQERFRQERNLSWTDRDVARGGAYLYRVIAFTLDGSRSAPSAVTQVTYTPPPAGRAAE
jgi:hypothetical protein